MFNFFVTDHRQLETIEMKLNELATSLTDLHTKLAAGVATITEATATTNKGVAEVSAKIDTLSIALGNTDIPAEAQAALDDLNVSAISLQDAATAQKAAADALDSIVPDAPVPQPPEPIIPPAE